MYASLVTHGYVLVESAALVHQRLGGRAVRDLFDAFVPALDVVFVDPDLHARAAAAYLAGLGRRVSLVDRVSFQLVRQAGLDQAFAFDRDFAREGIRVVP
jgi:predicted nucleic acid-binding protein